MEIEIKTTAYAENANYKAVVDALIAAGFDHHLNLGGKRLPAGEAVTITTTAPVTVLDGVPLSKSAVTVRA